MHYDQISDFIHSYPKQDDRHERIQYIEQPNGCLQDGKESVKMMKVNRMRKYAVV